MLWSLFCFGGYSMASRDSGIKKYFLFRFGARHYEKTVAISVINSVMQMNGFPPRAASLVTQDPAFNSRAECFDKRRSSGDSNVLPGVAVNFENLVPKVFPIAISSAAMVKEKGRLIGSGIFELDEQFSTLDSPAALCALLYFRHCFLTSRGSRAGLCDAYESS